MAYRKRFFRGAQADTASGKSMSPGTSASGGQRGGGGGGPHGGGEWSGPTYSAPKTVTVAGPHRGDGIGSQTFNKNLRTLQRRQDYNRGAYQRAHPFLSKMGGLGGLLKGIGKAGLSFFGGIPGKLMSGIMTASDYAKRKGSGVLQGIGEFAETDEEGNPLYPTWDRYINRNTGKYDDQVAQVATDVVNPNLNNLGVDNQFVEEEEQNLYPTTGLGAAEGGRIGYRWGESVDPEEPAEDVFEFMQDQGISGGDMVEGEITEEQKAMVLDMLEKGMDMETIISITGLGQADIMTLMGGTSMAPEQDQGIASLV